jgi:hypothetical protein
LSTTNPTWIDPGANPGLRGERPATNDLSHGTALVYGLVVMKGVLFHFKPQVYADKLSFEVINE